MMSLNVIYNPPVAPRLFCLEPDSRNQKQAQVNGK